MSIDCSPASLRNTIIREIVARSDDIFTDYCKQNNLDSRGNVVF